MGFLNQQGFEGQKVTELNEHAIMLDEGLTKLIGSIVNDGQMRDGLRVLKDKLVELAKKGFVKPNHSVMELLCAWHLMLKGFLVDVERALEGALVCDVYAVKGSSTLIVEIETGYTPPEHAFDPRAYNIARIISKIARYSAFSDRFGLATHPTSLLEIPLLFLTPPRLRDGDEVLRMKRLCDLYYKNPPITAEEIRNARVHSVFIVDADARSVRELDIEEYINEYAGVFYKRYRSPLEELLSGY